MRPAVARTINTRPLAKLFADAMVFPFVLSFALVGARAAVITAARQQSLEEWRNLTSSAAGPPRVFVKGHRVRFHFQRGTNVTGFSARWEHHRIPTDGYAAASALLRWDKGLSRLPESKQGWREATVIAGAAWRNYATNLIEALTPQAPWHGVYYQAFLADRVLYRDAQGVPHLAPQGEQPPQVIIDHRFPLEETLEVMARQAEKYRTEKHPEEELFLFRFGRQLIMEY